MSGRSGSFEFLFWFSSVILLSKIRSLFFSLWKNICQIPHDIFGSTNSFSFKLCIIIECHQKQILCTFLVQTLCTLVKSSPFKCKFLTFLSARVKIFKIPQVSSFSNFPSFFIITTHNSPVNFMLIHFLLWIKGPNKSPNFENFVCSSENLPKSSCHFPNHKLFFLQILHHSLVSWKITPLYYFS